MKVAIKMLLLFVILFFPAPLTIYIFGSWTIANVFVCIFWVVIVVSLLDEVWK